MRKDKREIPKGKKLIFRKWIIRNGEKVFAHKYGIKAFPILIDVN